MSNRGLLIVVIVILTGIFAVLAIEANKKSPGEQIASDISEMTGNISNKINDRN